jgi:diguanylate cyclase
MPHLLQQLAEAVAQAEYLEELTRPALKLLQHVSGLESAYLTRIDKTAGTQEVLYAHNQGDLNMYQVKQQRRARA